MRFIRITFITLFILFILPALAHLAVWSARDHPRSWHEADWSSADIFPKQPAVEEAGIWVMSARTGGLKGAFATHSWLVLKKPGQAQYDRYDVVGWGRPVRHNGYAPDAHWYSNAPRIDHHISGTTATALIPAVQKAITTYRWREYGDYTLWPGPNSNTFVASVLHQVPKLAVAPPATAVGRDFPWDGRWAGRRQDGAWFVSLLGYAGANIGGRAGFELHFLGLVTGVTAALDGVKLPGFGTLRVT
ncbi:MAG: DUF3750 domain-containing protein [Pseudomonadota bacterium]